MTITSSGPVSLGGSSSSTIGCDHAYTTPGTFTWYAPSGVTSVSAVAVGGGAGGGMQQGNNGGGQGGALAWRNNISVSPGSGYTVVVGYGGGPGSRAGSPCYIWTNATAGCNVSSGRSYFINSCTVRADGGSSARGYYNSAPYTTTSSYVGQCGGTGGKTWPSSQGPSCYPSAYAAGGGGAGGYIGNGGGYCLCFSAGGGGGQGGSGFFSGDGGGGGGVSIYGQGFGGGKATPLPYQFQVNGGSGGSCGCNGGPNRNVASYSGLGGLGGAYGGGGGLGGCGAYGVYSIQGGSGASGAVRIVWSGTSRQFPSTAVCGKTFTTYVSVEEEIKATATSPISMNCTCVRILAGSSSGQISFSSFYSKRAKPRGCATFTSPGVYTWVVPCHVYSVSVVAVGAGGNSCSSGGGGGLGWYNNIIVKPGASVTVKVSGNNVYGASYFASRYLVAGGRGCTNTNCQGCQYAHSGFYVGQGGGSGGSTGYSAGSGAGGAGGYTGGGGAGGYAFYGYGVGQYYVGYRTGGAGSGGAGGGGASGNFYCYYYACNGYHTSSGAGGGVGIYGQGGDGAGGQGPGGGGGAGSGGNSGGGGNLCGTSPANRAFGGAYGGGAGSGANPRTCSNQLYTYPCNCSSRQYGGVGAVRIIWPGCSRGFPSTDTGT
jgi:hypothetical protein